MPIDSQFGLQLAKGRINDTTSLFKFGENANVDTGWNTIWDGYNFDRIYDYATAADTVYVCTSNANDNPTIVVVGLDADWNEVTQEVTVVANGVTAVDTPLPTPLIRVYRAYRKGAVGAMVDDILIGQNPVGNVPQTMMAIVSASHHQTMMCVYTVPANHTLYLFEASITSGTETGGRYIEGRVIQRPYGEPVFRTMASFTLKDSHLDLGFGAPIKVPAKTDIEIRARSSSSANFVTAHLIGLIVKD